MKNPILKNAKKPLMLLSFILLLNIAGKAQLFTFTFTGASACPTNGNSVTNPSNATVSSFSRNTIVCNSTANVFNSKTLNTASTRSNTSYIEFTISANSGYVLNLDSLIFFREASNSAPNSLIVSYSTDSANFNTTRVDMSTSTNPTTGSNLTWVFPSTITTGVAGKVTFRFYPFGTQRADNTGASSASGTFRLDDVSLYGSVLQNPSVAISSAHPSASNIYQGSTDNIIGGISLAVTTATATINGVTVTTAGTYTSSDISTNGFKFWLSSSSSSISGATQLGSAQAAVNSGGNISVSGLSANVSSGTTRYILVTASIASGATASNTIRLASTAFSNISFVTASKTGTDPVAAGATPSNDQTIITALPTISLANGTISSGNITQNTTNNVIYRIDVTIGTTTATLNTVNFTTGGTYSSSDISNLNLWYSTSTSFSTGTATNIATISTSLGTGSKSFSSLSQTFAVGTAYLYITTDVPCAGTTGNTINVSAISNTSLAFATGTPSGSSFTSGGSKNIVIATPLVVTSASASGTGNNGQISVSWTNPTGCFNEVMIVASTSNNTAAPANNNGSSYIANLIYDSGSAIGNGFVVYKGSTSPQVITGLTNGVTYYFKIYTRWDTAWASGVTTEVSSSPFLQPTLTELYLPQYMQGNSSSNNNRVPFVYRARITGLLPYATYRYMNQVVLSTDGANSNGAGNQIIVDTTNTFTRYTSASLSSAYGTFTSNAAGAYSGWFITEPTGNTRFTPGNKVYMVIILNNGNGGTSTQSYVRTTDSVTVLNFTASSGSTDGSGLYGVSHANAKNMVMVYDNENGTGRPISSCFVESDGTANTSGNSYASFYSSNVEATASAWGTIIPNTNLSNGIRRVEFIDSLGNSVYAVTSSNGIWNSTTTVNPTASTTGVKIPRTGASKLIVNQNTTLNSSLNVSNTITLNAGTLSVGTNTLTDTGTVTRTSGNMDVSSGKIVFLNSSPMSIPSSSFSGSIAKLSVSGSASVGLGSTLNVTDSLVNSDTISGTIIMSGSSAQKISGTGVISSLTINNGAGVTIASGNNQTITTSLTCSSGLLNTSSGSSDGIILGSSATISENNSSNIAGRLKTTRTVLQNAVNTFGGLGLSIIESTQSSNSYVVTRMTGTPISSGNPGAFSGNQGIKRYYTITPTVNSGLSAQVIFYYRDGELNGITEGNLRIYTHVDPYTNGSWTDLGGRVVVNTSTNTIKNDPKYPVTHFSTWSFSSDASPLPVELVTLSGTLKNGVATINWVAANEDINSTYVIKHGSDIYNTNAIGTQAALCNGEAASYELVDHSPLAGINYYQLWVIQASGNTRMLGQLGLDNNGTNYNTFTPVQLFPNPASNNIQLLLGSIASTTNKVRITNTTGSTIMEQGLNGQNMLSLDIAHLPAGVYHIAVYGTSGELLHGQRFVKN